MSLKIHFLYSHLDLFPDSGTINDEQNERFYQDVWQNNIIKEDGIQPQ
jgi:hypothetical protein